MTKVKLFSQNLQKIAGYFKALGYTTRLTILKYPAQIKVCITSDTSKELPISRTIVNQHLKVLISLNLICGDREGMKVIYCHNYQTLGNMVHLLNHFLINFYSNENYC